MKITKTDLHLFSRVSLCLLVCIASLLTASEAADYDVLIRGGRLLDGSLKPAFRGDVAVKDGVIVKVGRSVKGSADRVINARGEISLPRASGADVTQRLRLEREGVKFDGRGRVDLKVFGWEGPGRTSMA